MRNIEYYWGDIAKVGGAQEAMVLIEGHQVTSFQVPSRPLSIS